MKYILAIGGETFPQDTENLKKYAGDVPVHCFIYGASEGLFGLARKIDEADAYVLLPGSGFFEFIPEHQEDSDVRPLLMDELKKGRKYGVIFTNRSGLYRYDICDVVEVVGFYGEAPVIRFCYRRNQVLNIADEKTNTEQLEHAIEMFQAETRLNVTGYCVQEDLSEYPGRYLVYAEFPGHLPVGSDMILDRMLCESSLDYKGCRHMNEINCLRIIHIPTGIFESYDKHLADQGYKMGQAKLLRILDTADKKEFFAKVYEKGMRE